MDIKKPPLDPYFRAWDMFESSGIVALNAVEAPLLVYVPDSELAERVAERTDGLDPHDLKWMILPDACPVADGHLNVVGGRQVSYAEASDPERHVMDVLTHATENHVRQLVHPEHGVGVFRFGRTPTMHTHIVPRRQREDGLDWTIERPLIPVVARHMVRESLDFALVEGRASELHRLIGAALLRFAV